MRLTQLDGLFPQLMGGIVTMEPPTQISAPEVQRILRLCSELMREQALGELFDDQRETALEQLKAFASGLRQGRIVLTGNACRDLLGPRRVTLTDAARQKATDSLLNLVHKAISELDVVPLVA